MPVATGNAYYALYDVLYENDSAPADTYLVSNFAALTGGEMTVSEISYTMIYENNNEVINRAIPGYVSYTPVSLLRAMDSGAEFLYSKFKDSVEGKLFKLRKNYSIAMIDGAGKPQVYWNLYDAIPIKIDGFSFNQHMNINYTDFQLTIHVERIEVIFVK